MFSKIFDQPTYIQSLANVENHTVSNDQLYELGKQSTSLWEQIFVTLGFIFKSAPDKQEKKRNFYIEKGNKIITAVNMVTLSRIFKAEELKNIDSNFKKENKDFTNVNQPKDLSKKPSRKEFVRELNQLLNQYQKKTKTILEELNLSKGEVLISSTDKFKKAEERIHEFVLADLNGRSDINKGADLENNNDISNVDLVFMASDKWVSGQQIEDVMSDNQEERIKKNEREILDIIGKSLGEKTKNTFEKACERHPILIRRLAIADSFNQLTKDDLVYFVRIVEGLSGFDSSFSLPSDLDQARSVSDMSEKMQNHGNKIVSLIVYYGPNFYDYVKLIKNDENELDRLDDIQEQFELLEKREEFKELIEKWFRGIPRELEKSHTDTDLRNELDRFIQENQEVIDDSLFINQSLENYKREDLLEDAYEDLKNRVFSKKTIAESKQEIIDFNNEYNRKP